MRPMRFRPFLIVVILALTLACVPTLPVAAPLPTQGAGAVETIIAATSNAAASQTAVFLPSATPTSSETPTPSRTPTETPTPTLTVVFRLPTLTFTPSPTREESTSTGGTLSCKLSSQSPGNGTVYAPKTDFDAKWTVSNNGSKTWGANSVDFVYVSGDKFYKTKAYDLSTTVDPDESITLVADMVAPNGDGTYKTTWGLRSGATNVFCTFSLTIVVK